MRSRWPWAAAEGGGRGVEVVERFHIHPGAGHGDDQIGMAEAQLRHLGHAVLPAGSVSAPDPCR
jgi:hypothetical protein